MDLIDRIVQRVPMRNPRALSRAIMEMVADGDLPPDTRMPTVRQIAAALAMSPASVAAAWRELVDWRVLETKRRGGTKVLGQALAPRATRFSVMMKASEGIPLNLGHLTPDRSILPPLEDALAFAATSPDLHVTTQTPLTLQLREVMEPLWPFPPQQMMATHGSIAALQLALETSVRPGDRVIVETPTVSRVLDILDAIGATAIPVRVRENGPDLEELRKALLMRPAAMIYQPVGSHPTGRSIDADWIEQAGKLLADSRMPILELVQTPLLCPAPWMTLGRRFPQFVVHIHAYNFFLGGDMRVGVVGGSEYYIDRMWQKLTFSSGWVSRILQNALAFQLSDPGAKAKLDAFIATCNQRQAHMVCALRQSGFPLPKGPGPTIWLPVHDEYIVTNQLSSRGIVVHPGSYFCPVSDPQHHVLINGTTLGQDHLEIARTIARADQI